MSASIAMLRHQLVRHRFALLPIALALFLFELIITRVAPAPGDAGWIAGIMVTVPPQLMALAGDAIATTPAGFLALGYGHPFFMLLVGAWTVRCASGALAGEIGTGTMDLIASRPVARWQIVMSGFVSVTGGLAVLLVAAWCGTAVGLSIRPLGIESLAFARVALMAWLLFTAWGAVGLLIGAVLRDGGQAVAWTTAVLAVSFVLDYVTRIWTPVKSLRPLSLFRYYEPQLIAISGLGTRNMAVLAGIAVTGTVAAILAFRWRDL